MLLDRLAARGIGVAVATSAPEKNVAHTLSAIGLADRIGVITRSDAVPRGKPFPDVFLRAAHELGVAPEACLAFEDAPVGVAAARSAGMRCVAITSTFSAEMFAATDSAAGRGLSRLRGLSRRRRQLAGELTGTLNWDTQP